MSYEDWGLRTFPRFLRGPWGSRFVAAVAGLAQRTEDGVREAVQARYAASAPSDALPYLAHDCDVPHLVESESLGVLRDRLRDPWAWHDGSGKAAGVDGILETIGFDPGKTYVIDRSLGESWCHESGWWSLWWVVTRNPTGWAARATTWDDLIVSTWDAMPSECWDATVHPSVFTQLRELLWRYKWAHGVPVAVVMLLGNGSVWDEGVYIGTTWGDFAAVTWDGAGANTTALVLKTSALYDNDVRTAAGDTYGVQTWDAAANDGQRWSSRIRPGS